MINFDDLTKEDMKNITQIDQKFLAIHVES